MNIFVTVGTGKFDQLIKEMDKIALNKKYQIIAQIGKSNYLPKNISYFRFKSSLVEEYKKADLVIAHAGAGTTYEVLSMQKKLISVANLNRTDQHQLDIVKKMSQEKYLLWCKSITFLSEQIKDVKNIKFKKYLSPKNKIAEVIINYLNN